MELVSAVLARMAPLAVSRRRALARGRAGAETTRTGAADHVDALAAADDVPDDVDAVVSWMSGDAIPVEELCEPADHEVRTLLAQRLRLTVGVHADDQLE